jgi:hypothetical protein
MEEYKKRLIEEHKQLLERLGEITTVIDRNVIRNERLRNLLLLQRNAMRQYLDILTMRLDDVLVAKIFANDIRPVPLKGRSRIELSEREPQEACKQCSEREFQQEARTQFSEREFQEACGRFSDRLRVAIAVLKLMEGATDGSRDRSDLWEYMMATESVIDCLKIDYAAFRDVWSNVERED